MKIPLFSKKPDAEQNGPKILRVKSSRAAKKASSFGKTTIEPMSGKPQKPGLWQFTLTVLYKNLYLLGVTLMRRGLRIRRTLRKIWAGVLSWLSNRLQTTWHAARRFFVNFWNRSKAPFIRIRRTYNEVKPDILAKRAAGKIPFAAYSAVIETVLRLIFKIAATVFNYTAPVAAAVLFAIIVMRGLNEPMVYTVQYKGEIIGYVEKSSEFNAAAQDVRTRVTSDGEGAFEISNPHFELMTLTQFEQKKDEGKIPKDADLLEKDALADILIQMSGSEVEEAYGLYIDEQFIGAILDKDAVLNEFDRIKHEALSGKPDERARFEKSIRLKPGLYLKDSLTESEDVLSIITSNETADEVYIVKANDTPTGIADKTGVPYDVIKELNPDIEDKLFEGMEVYTQVARPFISVQTTYTDIVEEEMPFETVETQNATYARGYRDVYQEGVNGVRRVTYTVRSVDGLERDRTEVSYEILKHPVDERVTVGINNPQVVARPPTVTPMPQPGVAAPAAPPSVTPPQNSGGFIWPVGNGGGYISCYLNGYWGHTGIDIVGAGGVGAPILASQSGTVVLARNTGVGYGRYAIIDHHNGYQTLYAHNSVLYVSVGDRVAQGQVIAGMGRTGNATGVHCHFEVRYNGRIMNPVNYVGAR